MSRPFMRSEVDVEGFSQNEINDAVKDNKSQVSCITKNNNILQKSKIKMKSNQNFALVLFIVFLIISLWPLVKVCKPFATQKG